jgi:Flp pilus assembly pilin Flp
MDSAMIEYLTALVTSTLHRRGVKVYDDRGAIAVEYAAMIVIGLGLIVIASLAIATKLKSNANSIPDNVPAPT